MPHLTTDAIGDILVAIRSKRFQEALSMVEAQRPHSSAEQQAQLQCCASLARWYDAGLAGNVHDGLPQAIKAVSGLIEAGWRAHLGWVLGSIGFGLGLVGDFETGLEWLELALEDGRLRGDNTLVSTSLSQKGAVLGFAGDLDGAEACFLQALELAGAAPSVMRMRALNNLAYIHIMRACQDGLPVEHRHRLARQALEKAEGAMQGLESPDNDRWRCWTLCNQAQALHLLGRLADAQRVYLDGLALGQHNPRGRLELTVGLAALLMETGDPARATTLLEEASALVPQDLVDSSPDRIFELQIRLAVQGGDSPRALQLWEQRFQQMLRRYRARSRNVRRHVEMFGELERAQQAQAKAERDLQQLDDRQSELQRQTRFWRNAAIRDPLTGLLNRRGLEQESAGVLQRQRKMAVAVVAVDAFEAVNQGFGAEVGDQVIHETGQLLAKAVGVDDVLARLRGSEFCLVLSPSDAAYARVIGERIRLAVERHAWERFAPGLRVTVSVGTTAREADEPLKELLSRAHDALRAARQSGTNRVH